IHSAQTLQSVPNNLAHKDHPPIQITCLLYGTQVNIAGASELYLYNVKAFASVLNKSLQEIYNASGPIKPEFLPTLKGSGSFSRSIKTGPVHWPLLLLKNNGEIAHEARDFYPRDQATEWARPWAGLFYPAPNFTI